MKALPLFALMSVAAATLVQAGPALDISGAVKVAQKSLNERKLDGDVWIKSISLESKTITGSNAVWVVSWNAPVLIEEGKLESGIEIKMDGSYVRYVNKTSVTPGTAGIPADRVELTNPRTRTKRPSVLDLKH